MDDDPNNRYPGYHHFRKLPTLRQAFVVLVIFLVILLAAWFAQQLGFWPQRWNANFDGIGE